MSYPLFPWWPQSRVINLRNQFHPLPKSMSRLPELPSYPPAGRRIQMVEPHHLVLSRRTNENKKEKDF